MQDKVYIAEDLRLDPNSLANPLVARNNGFRFYAATPLKSSRGYNLGTMCLIDTKPRAFNQRDQDHLECFGRLVMAEMEHRLASRNVASLAATIAEQNRKLAHAASHDALTGLLNRRSIDHSLQGTWSASGGRFGGAILILDVDRFKSINDRHGHDAGDAALIEIAKRIGSAVRSSDHVGRYGGEEFIVILNDCDLHSAREVAERIRRAVEQDTVDHGSIHLNVTISGGLCLGDSAPSIEMMLKSADKALYSAKNSGRNRIVLAN